jgi:hypothetical protein
LSENRSFPLTVFCSLSAAFDDEMRALNTIERLFALSVATALAGCATADFTPYVGAQQNWLTSSGAFVQTIEAGNGLMSEGGRYKLPVYFGPPNKPYRVIGYLDAENGSLASKVFRADAIYL